MTLAQVLALLQTMETLEPIVINAILKFVDRMKGKSTDEILDSTDVIWNEAIEEAQRELG